MKNAVLPPFGDIEIGQSLEPLPRGPLTPAHLMRWSASIENWHRIHYDLPFAVEHDGLPGLLVNGSWKQHFLTQAVKRSLGHDGWLLKIGFQFRQMDVCGSTLTAWGSVSEKREVEGLGVIGFDIGIRDEGGRESTPGSAVGVVPLNPGVAVPYPFPAELASRILISLEE